ncbi:sugar fermentation stimulation protein [Psychrosphaera saromensis]|uniref:Sugar fermentation stimulation protein homolog n=1 Tax=Psychrosphaera saromensis TaxID=716813 RepID=A0A2S7UR11_9GAMM|nr:DNA/RNA nuclease SfsA [Psychrosphaera saromensis]PQJ52373.1 sugar fermentation stimulation protein SfsA [Psychrosphaera saromensis]GHB73214.1 sugar fermentation stimulation protein [Psychrosphaera saromensis]GLQ13464.1 sugar fermentation stimulation protein [Psychrosphaera saromensis]
MKHSSALEKGTLIKRYKRFLADVETENGDVITIHCPNTGAMTGCAEPGYTVYYSTSDNPKRKYPNTFELAQNHLGHFIGINTTRANHVVKEAILNHVIPSLNGYSELKTEVKYGNENSRIDILLTDNTLDAVSVNSSSVNTSSENNSAKPDCYIEVKSTTLLLDEESGLGAFPDAVTTRGQKHIRELAEMIQQGHRAVLVFLVQHSGIDFMKVADNVDAKYADELKKAFLAGLEIIVLHTQIDVDGITANNTSKFQWSQ